MFSRMRSLNRKVSWGTKPICLRSAAIEYCRIGSAIDQHRSGFRIIDARNQVDQSCLSRSCGSDNRETAARGNPQVKVVQHRLSVVAEIQAAEFDLAFDRKIARLGSYL